MKKSKFYIGIDISKKDFASSLFTEPDAVVPSLTEIANDISGFEQFESWLINNQASQNNCVICLEATGVYGESLCYWLTAKGYQVAVEPPLKVKRAFKSKGHKNDKVDSRNIAQYAFRFEDELRMWRPKDEIVEQMNTLLTAREQLVVQKTACTNMFKALQIKVVQTPLVNKIHRYNIKRFESQIRTIEKELKKHIDKRPDFKDTVRYLDSIPGVGLLLAANFLVATNGFVNDLAVQHRKAAAFIGICPYEYVSGSSVFRRPRIPKYGPSRLRKLLHLAARSVVVHNQDFRMYYVLKQAQGKAKRLVLNNVSNKILKIMCAVVRNQRTYVDNFVSVHPQNALINA